ncbi:hypothetical protein Zmor_014562 [Zophobas morio]|uniref:Gustatory receptor n=1 Tax=Zophobas morio TaxID=2755281 RepID=A0AA38MFQ0_9CUCU|nr:hypothetical protein Zmor_014562 [Zophobas morio]
MVQLAIDVSKVFDVITIASMVLWFGYVIDMIYISIRSMLELKSFRLIVLCSQMLNISFFFVWLLIVVRMYTRTEKEANLAIRNVHQIWNKYYSNGDIDEKMRNLQLISLRMLNTKLHFTARNFFALDHTFFHMMIGAVTTYLVILIQFRV